MTVRPTMNPLAQWIVWFVLGAGNALLTGIGGVILVVALLLMAVRLAFGGDPMSALSGLSIGFGTTWLALMARQADTGGHLDEAGPWLALGFVAVAFGVLFAVLRLIRWGRTALLSR